jgi:hypothetical protein
MLSRRCLLSSYQSSNYHWARVVCVLAGRRLDKPIIRIRGRAHLYKRRAQISGTWHRRVALRGVARRLGLGYIRYLEYYAMFRIPDRPASPRHAFKFPRPPGSPPHALGNQSVLVCLCGIRGVSRWQRVLTRRSRVAFRARPRKNNTSPCIFSISASMSIRTPVQL